MKESSQPTTWQRIVQLDKFLDFHAPLLFLLLLLFVLRLPNYFEPYWYGDEGIYLTIGKAMNHGRELYAEIIDHKTPLIYFFAQLSEQLYFRLLLTAWMLLSTVLFYTLSFAFFKRRLSAAIATLVFVVYTTLPWLEGNIPNGELFVIGFVLFGGVLMLKSALFQRFLDPKFQLPKTISQKKFLFAAGVSFGLAILTKVPGLFDLLAFLSIGVVLLANELSFSPRQTPVYRKLFLQTAVQLGIILTGAITAIIASIAYFFARGTLESYLEFGLLYNFRYAGSWGLPFEHPLLVAAFSLQGKFLIAAGVVLLTLLLRRFLRPVQQFALSWFALALFASLLSNRPYPHYFLQTIPPLALLAGSLVEQWLKFFKHTRLQKRDTAALSSTPTPARTTTGATTTTGVFTLLSGGAVALFLTVLSLLNVGYYPTASYYANWWSLISGQHSRDTYNNSFNHLMADNYAAAPILATAKNQTILIWGTNPVLYALSDTIPAGRFTVAFHIADFDAFDETMESIRAEKPEYIVTMHGERHPFPALFSHLQSTYIENYSFEHFSIWRRRSI